MRKRLDKSFLLGQLNSHNVMIRRFVGDTFGSTAISECNDNFLSALKDNLVNNKLLPRLETQEILRCIEADEEIVVLHGAPGTGKSGITYELACLLKQLGISFLAARIDRTGCGSNAGEFGRKLGLEDAPVTCLAAIAGTGKSVLIIDQVDAIRWTSAQSEQSLTVCKQILRQLSAQRVCGRKMTLVLACRTFDLENDPGISSWLQKTKGVSRVDTDVLPIEAVQKVVDEHQQVTGVSAEKLEKRTLELLRNVQNLKIWTEIVTSDATLINFHSTLALQRRCWQLRKANLVRNGLNAMEIEEALSSVVSHMERNGLQIAPRRILPNDEKLISELLSSGCIVRTGNDIHFSHQTDLEFLIADNALDAIVRKKRSYVDWLGGPTEQSLLRRESLKQLIFLTGDEAPKLLCSEIPTLMASDQIRLSHEACCR